MTNYEIQDPQLVHVDGWDEAWKFSGGLMIIRYWNKYTAKFNSEWYGVYESHIPFTPLPIPQGTFVGNPFFMIGDSGYGELEYGHWYESIGGGSTTQSPSYYALRPNLSEGFISYSIIAIGRWK